MGGTHWTCFVLEDNISYYFDSFGCQPNNFLLQQLPKPKIYLCYIIHNTEIVEFVVVIAYAFSN